MPSKSEFDILSIVSKSMLTVPVIAQRSQLADSDTPKVLFARYVAAEVKDLYGATSSDAANLERLAASLDNSASALAISVKQLRQMRSSEFN